MKRIQTKKAMPYLIIPLLVTAACGCDSFLNKDKVQDVSVVQVTQDPVEAGYDTVSVKRGSKSEKEEVYFYLKSTKKEDLSFGVSGLEIKKVYVKEKEFVKKGKLIASLGIEDLVKEEEECQSQLKGKEMELNHQKRLLAIKEKEVSYFSGRSTQIDERKASLTEIKDMKDSIKLVEEEIKILQKELKKANREKKKRCIYAPMDGYVTNIQKPDRYGEYLAEKGQVFAQINDAQMFFQSCELKEKKFRVGQALEVLINKKPFGATITDMKKLLNENYVYSIKLNEDRQFKEGTLAYIYLKGNSFHDELYVDAKAVFHLNKQPAVYMLNDEGFKEVAKIETGVTVNGFTVIKSGMKEGDQVVLE